MDTTAVAPRTGFAAHVLSLSTTRGREFIDITEEVETRIAESALNRGLVVVASRHTTGAVVINEHEPELLKDLDRMLTKMAPLEREYAHNGVPCGKGEQPNGHAHCQALLLSATVSIPFDNARLSLGRYQRVFFVELDCPRERQVSLMVLGC
ncbi:MAG: secondary thiamine-phosphate synthase enzyme YjbQ [Chloroflexota bacterium]|nr:MAG: secondary thiamine-phosphate synthase enzyme [Chloroflexota bacterium]